MFKNKHIENVAKCHETERILSDKTNFNTVETYKAIRTNIMFSLPKKEHGKVISVTSAVPNEGKTTTCINLAITFAQTGARVVLIDCDLRKARVHRYFEKERGEGVSNILCGFADTKKAIVKNVRENLDILTAGEIPLNPAELLETSEFENLIDELKKEYDYIFIDTTPVAVVTDAVIVSKLCDGVVLVVREKVTTFDMLDEAINILRKTNARILGAIMLSSIAGVKKYGYKNKYANKYDYRYAD